MVFSLFGRKKGKPSDDQLYPGWQPNIPIDHSAIVDRMQYYGNGKYRFVVFANGTCAFVSADSTDPHTDAVEVVKHAAFGHVDFNPRLMDDGNYLVGFGQKACGVVLSSELKDHAKYIADHHLQGVRRDEVFLKDGAATSNFDERGRAGLLARARLFMDSKQLAVVQVCEASK